MIKLLKNLGKKEWLLALVCLVLIIGQVWLELKMPDYMSEITILVQTQGSEMSEIVKNGGYMLACAFGSLVSAIIVGYIASGISATFSMKVRKKLFNKVGNLGMSEVKQFSTSSLITRTTNDITQIQMVIAMGLQLSIKAPITAIWAITKILNKSWQWSSLTAVGVVILLSVIVALMAIVMPRFKIVQKLIDKINEVTRENLTGIRVVRAFNAEKYQEDKFEEVNTKLTNQQLFNQKAFSVLSPTMYLVMYFLTLGIYFIGAYLIRDAGMADKIGIFGNMVVFSSYAMQVIMSFLMLAMIFMMLPRAQVSANRINEIIETEETIKDSKEPKKLNPNKKGLVEFKNVSFRYPDSDEEVLSDISFTAEPGKTTAIIGSTGSGKSTIVNLIPRFYDVTSGNLLIDGVDIKDISNKDLRKIIGFVPQKGILFSGTIESNIKYGNPNMSDEQMIEAAQIAQATEFIESKPEKYQEPIAQGGSNVSGGQKQRLSIARAIAIDPEILVFDDSFSALDFKTDSILRAELAKKTQDKTVIIVAQRINTILNADQIIVLEDGKVVGKGTHEELIKTNETYKQIALSQLSAKELNLEDSNLRTEKNKLMGEGGKEHE